MPWSLPIQRDGTLRGQHYPFSLPPSLDLKTVEFHHTLECYYDHTRSGHLIFFYVYRTITESSKWDVSFMFLRDTDLISRISVYIIHDLTYLISDLLPHVFLFIVSILLHIFLGLVAQLFLMAECDNCELNYFSCIVRHGVLPSAVQCPTCHQACTLSSNHLWRCTSTHVLAKTKKRRFCGFTVSDLKGSFKIHSKLDLA